LDKFGGDSLGEMRRAHEGHMAAVRERGTGAQTGGTEEAGVHKGGEVTQGNRTASEQST
jgi:hypothetical protein